MSETGYNMELAEESEQINKLSDWPSPGQKMKIIREEMGLSYARVAEALHMTAHYVRSLESDQYDKLPGKTFVKGYFKAYARLLEADVNEVLECYEQYVTALEASQENEADEIRAKKAYDQNLRWMICAAIIIVLVIGLSWWFSREENATVSTIQPVPELFTEVIASSAAPVTAEVLMANLEESRGVMSDSTQSQQSKTAVIESEITNIDTQPGIVASSENLEALSGNALADSVSEANNEIEAATSSSQNVLSTENVSDDSYSPEWESSLDTSLPAPQGFSVNQFEDHREVQLETGGEDLLEIHFSGTSWIEVDNVENARLYQDILNTGDDLRIRGKAPFNILIGDANMVEMTFNSKKIDILARMRTDNSVRLILAPEDR
jgi:cytoskeleton protein RodZ